MGVQNGGVSTMSESYRNSSIWNSEGAILAFSQSVRYPLKLRMKLSSKPWSRSGGSTQTLKIKSWVPVAWAQNVCL